MLTSSLGRARTPPPFVWVLAGAGAAAGAAVVAVNGGKWLLVPVAATAVTLAFAAPAAAVSIAVAAAPWLPPVPVTLLFFVVWVAGMLRRQWSPTRIHLLLGALAVGEFVLVAFAGQSLLDGGVTARAFAYGVGLCAAASSFRVPPRYILLGLSAGALALALLTLVSVDWAAAAPGVAGLGRNGACALIGTGTVAVVGLLAESLPRRQQAAAVVALVPMLTAVVVLKSRSGFVALTFGLLVLLLARVPLRKALAGGALALLLGGVALSAAGPTRSISLLRWLAANDRAADDIRLSNDVHLDLYRLGMQTALQHPLTGVGPGNFVEVSLLRSRYGEPLSNHNTYLRLAAESGILVVAGTLALLVLAARVAARQRETALLAVLAALVATGLFSETLAYFPVAMVTWLVLGATLGLSGDGMRTLRRPPAQALSPPGVEP